MECYREMCFEVVKEACSKSFGKPLKAALGALVPQTDEVTDGHMHKLYFGNFMIPDAFPREYDEVGNFKIIGLKVKF